MPILELSIVIPCLNEEQTIGICVAKAMKAFLNDRIRGEVVVIDNGSVDRSSQIARENGARVIFHEEHGYGSALKRGIAEATGEFIVMGDGDNTYDFSEIGKFLGPLHQGADLVMGSRLKGRIRPGAMPWLHRWVGTPVLSFLMGLFFNTKVSDVNCGIRGFRKDVVQRLSLVCNGMEFASEMIIKAAQMRMNIQEVAVSYFPMVTGRHSHLNTFRDGWRHLKVMLLFCPKYLFLFPGLFLSFVGVILTLFFLAGTHVVFCNIHFGLSMALFANALILMGMQIALFGISSMIVNTQSSYLIDDRIRRFFKDQFTLERGTLMGGSLFVVGVILGLTTIDKLLIVQKFSLGIDESLTKLAMLSIFVVLLGLQIIFSTFYISLLQLSRTLK